MSRRLTARPLRSLLLVPVVLLLLGGLLAGALRVLRARGPRCPASRITRVAAGHLSLITAPRVVTSVILAAASTVL